MTKRKPPAAKVAATEPAVTPERPRAGGSYVRDRATGELTRVPHPKAQPAPEPVEDEAEAPPAGSGEQQQANPGDQSPPANPGESQNEPGKSGEQEA